MAAQALEHGGRGPELAALEVGVDRLVVPLRLLEGPPGSEVVGLLLVLGNGPIELLREVAGAEQPGEHAVPRRPGAEAGDDGR